MCIGGVLAEPPCRFKYRTLKNGTAFLDNFAASRNSRNSIIGNICPKCYWIRMFFVNAGNRPFFLLAKVTVSSCRPASLSFVRLLLNPII